MKRRYAKKSFFMVVLLLSLLCFMNGTVQAASEKEKAQAVSFCLINLNGDQVPELLVKCNLGGGWGGTEGYLVYTYKNKKVQRLAVINGGESVTKAYYYPKAKLLREDWTRWGYTERKRYL